jgi:hypothetical protein
MKKLSPDIVIAICSILGIIGAFAAWADTRYAHQDTVQTMQSEIAQIYEKLIPEAERKGR